MMTELMGPEREAVRGLFEGMGHHLALRSVIDGTNPGRVLADAARSPRAALIVSTEGLYLAGDPERRAFVAALAEEIDRIAASGQDTQWLDVHPEAWEARLPEVLRDRPVARVPRRHYVCTEVRHDWRARLPEGYEVRAIDGALLADPALHVPEHIRRWIETNWGSHETFLRLGFGQCVLWGSEVVSWSVCDCVSGDECEIGIQTADAHRRRGLAAATAAAAVECALSKGYRAVGWHCDEDNVGSWKTAERVGFVQDASYTFRVCQL
jgi:RimJ/RimL family protein N-acetyltransferase